MKKRRLIFRPLILIPFLLSTVACSDKFFDQQAGDRITPGQHYHDLKDLEISMEGTLYPLQNVLPKLILVDGLRSDQMDITSNTSPDLKAIYNQELQLGNPYLDASDLYKVIINVNEVLSHINDVTKNDPQFDVVTRSQYTGYLIGVKAYAYLTLVRLYNNVVWIPDNMTEIPTQQLSIAKDALLDSLITELKPYILDSRAKIKYTEMRLTDFPNTKGMLGELYLEKNNYDSAVVFLKMACESYGNALTMLKVDKAFQQLSWKNIFIGAENNSTENIGVIPFSSTEDQPSPLAQWMLYNDQYVVKPAQVLVDSFYAATGLKGVPTDVYRGKTVTFDSIPGGSDIYISKYSLEITDLYGSDIIMQRAAGLHLLLAEALNRSSDPNGSTYAMVLINGGFQGIKPLPKDWSRWANNLGTRGRAYVTPRVIPASVTDPAQIRDMVEDFILDEKSMEMAFEGQRFFDLERVAKRRNDPTYLANKVAAKYTDPDQKTAVLNKLSVEDNWYLPQ